MGFTGATGGGGRVVVADVSAADGSVLASAGVDVVLPGGPPPGPPPGPPLGRVVGATYANPAAGYAHELPASWISHGYRWYESWVQQADQARPGAAYVAEWVYVPADPAKPEAALVTIAVYPAAVWASLAAQGGPPVGQALAATARWVYAWSGRQDAPYGDGSADDQQAAALYADAHVVVDTFRLLPAAGRPPAGPPGLVGTTWAWTGLTSPVLAGPAVVPDPARYTLLLDPAGTYEARADCNRLAGRYTLQGASLTLTPGPATLAVCPPPSRSEQYALLLGQVDGYAFEGAELVLTVAGGAGRMTFRAVPAAPAPA